MSKQGFIQLRTKQALTQLAKDPEVTIFAPLWVKTALEKVSAELQDMRFNVGESKCYYTINKTMTLIDLVAIARAESVNTTGIINFSQYPDISEATVIALRDLVKHCVIVGKDVAIQYGGYPNLSTIRFALNQEVYICDLPGLQFQALNNTGRHVLLTEKGDLPKGALDEDIYLNTVGETKKTYQQAIADNSGRFLTGFFKNTAVIFDTKAFHAFVAQDFVLSAQALNRHAKAHNPQRSLNFKFLKYGAGFFAEALKGKAREELDVHLTLGVLLGLRQLLLVQSPDTYSQIKRIELPFFNTANNPKIQRILDKIALLCKQKGIEFASDKNDALAPTSTHMTATTNCSDPHAPTGNEMNYGSVDAAIAENLKRKGNNFSPICNPEMKAQYVIVQHLGHDAEAVIKNILKPTSLLQHIKNRKWSLLVATVISAAIRVESLLWLGLRASWATCLSVGGLVLLGVELIQWLRDSLKTKQYKNYKSKEVSLPETLTDAQREAFAMGKEAAQSFIAQAKSCFMWQGYRSANDYYAGYQASLLNDESLMSTVKNSKKIK
ncbi:hypothetical protein CC99x_010405 [Candidatus Berkiella cookevillensis]|uniref:Uncharacterized protein n=1 Tax=Candidatus Berkiella cookevillensis TaxID=437022 RepID=A0A0Q9YQ88_9GAMM|nr:hypothetical protein [Candidatus Berkiella cookevillensis]MCS5709316.1 hypothetical protein [Candidatus Berkiella cookevillensis]